MKNIEIKVSSRSLFKLGELKLNAGLIALIGRNGTGKSTFLRTILGEHKNFSGLIKLDDKNLADIPKSEMAKLISVVYSKPDIFGNHSVKEVLLLGRLPYQNLFANTTQEDLSEVNRVLELLELKAFADKQFSILSDGEKQLAMIGRALVQNTPIILLDEPGAFLDLVNRYKLAGILKKIVADSNKLVIYSTHHIDLLENYCSGVLLIAAKLPQYGDNEMKYLSEVNQFLPEIKRTFGL